MDIKEAQLNSPELQTCTNIKTHSGSQNTNQSRKRKLVSTTKKLLESISIRKDKRKTKYILYPEEPMLHWLVTWKKSCPTTLTDHHQWCVRPFILAGR